MVTISFATDADGFASRSLFEKEIFFATKDGTIHTAKFWSIHLGQADFTVQREYPGEGTVDVAGSTNLSLISSGYIDGSGYGDRGKITVQAHFVIERNGALQKVDIDSIDYVYYAARKVKMIGQAAEEDLHIQIETPENKVKGGSMTAMVYEKVKPHYDLVHKEDFKPVIGFSFTKAGAKKAYQAALKAAE